MFVTTLLELREHLSPLKFHVWVRFSVYHLGRRAGCTEQVSLACSSYVSNFDNQGRKDYQAQDEYVKAENNSQCQRKDSTLSYRLNLTMHHTNMEKLFKKKVYEKVFERSFCN